MWCRSAVSFSFLFLVTAPRMRSCACDTASRLCVRTVLCNSAFLSVPLLPSTGSAAECPALFAGFAGIISESDFFVPFIIGYGLRPYGCQRTARGRCGSLLLHRSGLAPPTPCRSPGALRVLPPQPRSLVSVGHVWAAELCATAARQRMPAVRSDDKRPGARQRLHGP